ncbi:hypothetical protein BDZ91DRAFT_410511 [Kalaharituber pfeilii]|nr:hypothetical protein BDZ91DRAFT_410511 [Kalaharituber pfeilii]
MASYFSSFMPQSAQKRLLKYVLTTYAPVLDPSTLDLDKLDVHIGRKSVISLSDVGIDGAKLHPMLNFPAELQISSASVGSLTINLPADLHRSGIEVFIDGVKVVATLASQSETQDGKNKKRKGRRKEQAEEEHARMTASVLPSPDELAREFVETQPRKVKRKLERSIAAFGDSSAMWNSGFDSDSDDGKDSVVGHYEADDDIIPGGSQSNSRRTSASSTHTKRPVLQPEPEEDDDDDDAEAYSDDDVELGTGTSLALPGFIASFIKGIGDRFQLHVGEVSASIQIPKSQVFPHLSLSPSDFEHDSAEKMVILELRIAGVAIEGVTVASAEVDISAFAPSGSGQIKAGKKKIQLSRLNAFLIGNEGLFDELKPVSATQDTGYDGSSSPYDPMQESVCTVKDVSASVATLKAGEVTPKPSLELPKPSEPEPVRASTPELKVPTPKLQPTKIPTAPSSTSSDDDFFASPYDSMAEDEHDNKMTASVVSLGSLSDTGTAQTSQPEQLTESQMFADPDSDAEDELIQQRQSAREGGGDELPFAMASYMATNQDAPAAASVASEGIKSEVYEQETATVHSPQDEQESLPPLPLSPADENGSQILLPQVLLPARAVSVIGLPPLRKSVLEPYSLNKSTPALKSSRAPAANVLQDSIESSVDSLPPPPPEPVIAASSIPRSPSPLSPIHPTAIQATETSPSPLRPASPEQSTMSLSYAQSFQSFHSDASETAIQATETSPSPLRPASPEQSTMSLSYAQSFQSFHSDASETESEDDEAARKKLSESMFFSHEDAGSLYLSAMSGVLESGARQRHSKALSAIGSDGAGDSQHVMAASVRGGRRKGELEGEELTEEELEERLSRLVGSVSRRGSADSVPAIPPVRRMRKKIAEIDYVEMWIPALSAPQSTPQAPPTPEPVAGSPGRGMEETHHQHLPGSFSMYGVSPPAKRPTKMTPSAPRPITPKISSGGVKFAEAVYSASQSPSNRSDKHSTPYREKDAEVEVFVGKVVMKTDLVIGGLLAKVLAAFGAISASSSSEEEKEKPAESSNKDVEPGVKKKVEVVVGEVDCRLVERVLGQILLEDGQPEQKLLEEDTDGAVILNFNTQHTRATVSTIVSRSTSSKGSDISTITKVSLGNIELRDTAGAFIKFVPELPSIVETSSHGHSTKGVANQSDIRATITNSTRGTRVEFETLPLSVKCQLERVDELLAWFGGFGSVLGMSVTGPTGFDTPTPRNFRQTKGVAWREEGVKGSRPSSSTSTQGLPEAEFKFDANIGGLIVDIEGEEGAIGLRTSIIKVRKRNRNALIVGIEKIVMIGPHLVDRLLEADAKIIVDHTRVEFSSKPKDEDLTRLLKLLTPSKDKFAPDDDILLDTLFEQRRQASVLRISMEKISGEVEDVKECERFLVLGDELGKIMTVASYIPQDDRPGLLTLFYVEGIDVGLKIGREVGKVHLGVRDFELSHVGGPNLIALAMGTIGVRRNGKEELIGEGLPKEIAIRGLANHAASGARRVTDDEDRPMVMVRMLGDDPEPVIKVKLWNMRLEYNVDTLMALMGVPGSTADGIAREMIDSIATLTEKQVQRELRAGKKKRHVNSPLDATLAFPADPTAIKPLRVEIVVRDSVLGLNPLILSSRGLFILTDSRFYIEVPSPRAELEMNIEMKRASVSLIDDVSNLLSPEEAMHEVRHRRRKDALTEHLAAFAELGYVSVASISSARAVLKLVESEVPGDKCVDLELWDDLFFMETCADSTQTLLGIVNGLKPPLPEGEEVKYCTEVMPLDMFASMIDDAFVPASRKQNIAGETSGSTAGAASLVSSFLQEGIQEEGDGDMVSDDVPMNLTFVESYYGNQNRNLEQSQEHLAEDILEDDLTHIAKPSRPLGVGEKGEFKTFEEQVQMLDDTPLEILDNHFSVVPRASLIEMAAKSAIGAPVRVKVRDVHIIWNLHDGYDWPKTRDTISKAVKRVEGRAMNRRSGGSSEARSTYDGDDDEGSVIGDLLFNSIYIGIPANRDPRELSRHINNNLDAADMMSETGSYASTGLESRPSTSRGRASGDGRSRALRLARSRTHKMQIELKGVCVDFVLFPQNGGETQSSVDLKVRDMEIIDNVPTSTWKKFVTYMRDAGKRETGSQMAHIEVLNVKPVPTLAASELVIKATILPLRLHVDQDTLDFMTRFFEFKDDTVVAANPPQEEPFIQRVEVNSVRVKLDYKPKRVDYVGLRSGHTTEFMNFVILEEADMVLRHVILHGISGFTRLSKALNNTWMPDIQRTQLREVLSGVAPSFANLGSGVKDLVVVPMREYKKDGRIIRSMSKGMVSFASKTTKELVRLGAKVAVGTQTVLENTEEFLGGKGSGLRAGDVGGGGYHHIHGPGDSGDDYDADEEEERVKVISLYADQPKNVTQGLRNAGVSLRRNLMSAREAIRAVPGEVAEKGSAQGVVQAVARAAPVAVLRPMIGASEAVSRTLLGVTNSLDKEMVRRVEDKYKKH